MTDILLYPATTLTNTSIDISLEEIGSEELDTLIASMKEVLTNAKGVGLAACQIGFNKKIALCNFAKEGIITIINPVVIAKNGNYWSREEGCLSIPGFRKDIKRYKLVKIKYLNEDGKECILRKENHEAAIIQHELDHMRGKLIINY